MAAGQTPIDAMVGEQPEDIVPKIRPLKTKAADVAEDVSRSGGETKVPTTITPFKLGGR